MKKLMTLLLVLCFGQAIAQSDLTLYHMKSLPQTTYVNPANAPDADWHFGLPLLSSNNILFLSNGMDVRGINSAFVPRANSDSFVIDGDRLSQLFTQDMYVNTNADIDLMHLGFRLGNSYWTFNTTERFKTRINVPEDLFHLLLEGNGAENLDRTFNLNFGLDMLHVREYALGFQHSLLNNRLRFGAKVKYIYGLNVINTERNDLTFTTANEDFAYTVGADLKLNMASSFMSFDGSDVNERRIFYGADNYGWGIDLGVSMDVTDLVTISASVRDVGQVFWNENVRNLQSADAGAEFEFKGFDIKTVFGDSVTNSGAMQELEDSLVEAFKLDTLETSFTTGLMSAFYLGGEFHITPNHNVGVLLYGNLYDNTLYPALTLSWNARVNKVLAASVSYSVMRGNYSSLGLGFSVNAGAFQFYTVSDNIFGNTFANGKSIGARVGMNFTFGRRNYEEKFE